MDTQRLALAEWPDHNWCKMQRRRPVAFHISDKTFFRPKLPACLKSTHRTRACYSTRNQWVNMQMPPSGQRSTLIGNIGSHDDVFFVVGFCVVVGSLRRRSTIIAALSDPATIWPHNENTRKRQQKLHSSSAVA